jgi:hypothetical protein
MGNEDSDLDVAEKEKYFYITSRYTEASGGESHR